MMTNREAIMRIKDHIEVHHIKEDRAIKIVQALNMAIEALERTEWHYPSKEEYPPKDVKVLVATVINNYYVASFNSEWITASPYITILKPEDIDRWKYIELPKEDLCD